MGQARNVCLVGHAGSGKSTLAISLLKKGGIEEQIVLDSSAEEKEHGYSIDMSFGACAWKDTRLTLLDTPGGDEFIEEMYKAVPVSDLTILTVNGEKGVETVAERAWEITGAKGRPTVVYVTHMDKENADFTEVLEELRDKFEAKFLPLQVPIVDEGSFIGVVGVISQKAAYFEDEDRHDIPSDLTESVALARTATMEEVASLDDELMMKFLEDEEISSDEAYTALRKGLAAGSIIPVMCGSPEEDKGSELLLDIIVGLTPKNEVDAEAECNALVFALATDPYLGRLNYVYVLAGALKEGNTYYDVGSGKKVEVRELRTFEGIEQQRTSELAAGSIGAIGKVEELDVGTTLAAKADSEAIAKLKFPKPVYSRTVVPKTQSDVEKMSKAIRDLTTTKTTVAIERNSVTREMILWGMGTTQLSIFMDRMKNQFNVELELKQPRIPYKETIRKKATARYRHKKQSGGRGQFGEVYLRIEPRKHGEGNEFVDEIKGASIPGQYIPGVEKGVVEAMEAGNLAHYPVTDVLVAVYDGSHHPVDSSEMAFKTAARSAFREAMDQGSPCLLEPVMSLSVKTPEDFTGDVVSDLNSRRGRILGMEPGTRSSTVKAEVPASEVQSYAVDLKSMTQGRATFEMEFAKYQRLPGNIQEKVIAEVASEKESN